MVLEIADIKIIKGGEADFEQAARFGLDTVLAKAAGFAGYEIRRSIESPNRFVLMIHWNTLEDHTVGFRQSSAYSQWRAIVSPFFEQAPVIEHFELAGSSATLGAN